MRSLRARLARLLARLAERIDPDSDVLIAGDHDKRGAWIPASVHAVMLREKRRVIDVLRTRVRERETLIAHLNETNARLERRRNHDGP